MSMSTHLIGFTPPDEKWRRMKTIWDSCQGSNIEIPTEVLSYFNDEKPDERGVEVELVPWNGDACAHGVERYKADMSEGYEVDLEAFREAHPHVKTLRFYNSW